MIWTLKCVFLGLLCLRLDLCIAQNWNNARDSNDVEGSGRLPFSDDEDFGDGESGSGSGSGMGADTDIDIIIDEVITSTTTTKRPPMRQESECERERTLKKSLFGSFVPRCLDNGDYESLMCDGPRGHERSCWCVDLSGSKIPGTEMTDGRMPQCEEGDKGHSLPKCVQELVSHQRQVHRLLGATRRACTREGKYKPQQCEGNVCFCVDEMDGEKKLGSEVNLPEFPDCDDDNEAPDVVTYTPILHPDTKDVDDGIEIDEEEQPPKVPLDENDMDLDIGETNDVNNNNNDDNVDEDVNETGVGREVNMKPNTKLEEASEILTQPGILAGIIGGSVVLLLCFVLLVMFIVYRMRKKDEGSYPLDDPHKRTPNYSYVRAPEREFYA